jgi:hypothetical protein
MQPIQDYPVYQNHLDTPGRGRLIQSGLPAALLALPIFGIFWLDEVGAILIAVVALAVGLFLRPAHLWVVWIQSIIIWWIAGGVYSLVGDSSGNGDETVLSFMIEAIPFTAMLILLPLFLGRVIGNLLFNTDD